MKTYLVNPKNQGLANVFPLAGFRRRKAARCRSIQR